jgi:hypothetical protein
MALALKFAKFYEDDIETYFYKRQVIPSIAERILASQETLRYKLLKSKYCYSIESHDVLIDGEYKWNWKAETYV